MEAWVTFSVLGGSFVVQALSAYSTGEGAVATIVALCGGKTMLDTYNVVYDKVIARSTFKFCSHLL